jgi:hypothetical protein
VPEVFDIDIPHYCSVGMKTRAFVIDENASFLCLMHQSGVRSSKDIYTSNAREVQLTLNDYVPNDRSSRSGVRSQIPLIGSLMISKPPLAMQLSSGC